MQARNIRNLPDGFLTPADAVSNAMNTHVDVALILWNRDVIELISLILHGRNLTSCGVEPSVGKQVIEDLIVARSPSVVVFDLDPPYARSAGVALRLLDRFPDCPFLITCADTRLALKNAAWLSDFVMFQKPYEVDEVADVVRSMVRSASSNLRALSIGAS